VNKVCAGNKAGTSCEMDYFCESGTYCASNTGRCTSFVQHGGTCAQDYQHPLVCGLDAFCDGLTCRPYYQQQEGDTCTNWWPPECAEGLSCNGQKCIAGKTADQVTKCTKDTECTSTTFFTDFCFCDSTGISVCYSDFFDFLITSVCTEQTMNFAKCASANRCFLSSPVNVDYMENSCVYRNCLEEMNNVIGCYCQTDRPIVGDCDYFEYCDASSVQSKKSGGKTVIILVVLLILFATLVGGAILFYLKIYKQGKFNLGVFKKKEYQFEPLMHEREQEDN